MKDHTHGKILVNGTLVFSLVVGMSVRDTSGNAIANLDYQKIIHHAPVFLGDTIYAESEIIDKRETSKENRGIVQIESRAFNQNGHLVMTFHRRFLVRKDGNGDAIMSTGF